MRRYLQAAAIASMLVPATVAARQLSEPTDTLLIPERAVVLTGDADKGRDLIAILYNREDMHFQDPKAPRFLFLDSQGKVAFGIGGYLKGTLQYDFDGSIDDGSSFTTYDIPVPANPALRSQFLANANHSTVFLQMVGRSEMFGYYQVYIRTNFTGGGTNGYGLKLKQAYVSLDKVTIGLTRSTFVDGGAGVPTIDDEGHCGELTGTNIIFQYRPRFTSHLSGAISVEMPQASYTVNTDCEAINQRVPDLPAYLQYSWGGSSHVRLSGLVRNLSYRDLVSEKNRFSFGWAAQLSGVIEAGNKTDFYYNASYGKGYARYVNDLSGSGFDLIPDGTTGTMKAPGVLAFKAGLSYHFTPDFFVAGSYSQSRLFDQTAMAADTYRYGQYVSATAFYNILPDLQVGVEYLYGNRADINHMHGHANRLTSMLQFSF